MPNDSAPILFCPPVVADLDTIVTLIVAYEQAFRSSAQTEAQVRVVLQCSFGLMNAYGTEFYSVLNRVTSVLLSWIVLSRHRLNTEALLFTC